MSSNPNAEIKIGITDNPFVRWVNRGHGYERAGWTMMYLLYAAPTSKVRVDPLDSESRRRLKMESTGAMETELINRFHHYPQCINRAGGGGDCPSNGSPHFCYVVLRDFEDY